jgi:hypothetical protein
MRVLFPVIVFLLVFSSISAAAKPYNWRALKVGQSTVKDAKKLLGEPHQEYREQFLYEKQFLDPGDPNAQPVRLDTVVLNIGAKGVIESVFLFPEWGITDEQLRPIFGKGQMMTYRKFLSSMGEVKIGAGTRPDEKLHYVSLDAPCEVFSQYRVLVLYSRQDVVTGNYLVQLILFY